MSCLNRCLNCVTPSPPANAPKICPNSIPAYYRTLDTHAVWHLFLIVQGVSEYLEQLLIVQGVSEYLEQLLIVQGISEYLEQLLIVQGVSEYLEQLLIVQGVSEYLEQLKKIQWNP